MLDKIEQDPIPPFTFQTRVGWGGKIINTGRVYEFQTSKLSDWQGLNNVTGTESDILEGGLFTPRDLYMGTLSRLSDFARKIVNSKFEQNHTLPITVFTYAGSYNTDPGGIYRPTVVVQLPEELINSNRKLADAFVSMSMNFEVKQGQPVSKKIYGKDPYAILRKPLLYYYPAASPEVEQKYGKFFSLKKIMTESGSVGTLAQEEKITFPSDWGIWNDPNIEKYLPLLSLLIVKAPSTLMSGTTIIINDGFGNDPTDPRFMHLKLDFMRAFHELTGKFWHFATNPIGRRTGTKGIIFVDPLFGKQESLIGERLVSANLDSGLGNQVSESHQVLELLNKFVTNNRQSNFINDPNMQLQSLRVEVSKVVG